MKHLNVYWSEDGKGSPCDYLISNKGQLTTYIGPHGDAEHVIFHRPAPGWHSQSYHQLLRLIAHRPHWAVTFHDFPDAWW